MKTRRLGNSDLDITALGIGAWAMGGAGWAFAWGAQDDEQSVQGIYAALDAGMNWIDTAAVYGLGHSEEVVGRAIKGLSQKPYIFTKCARTWTPERQITKTLKAESVRRECEDSLRRLQVEVIDLYQVHWPEPDEDVEEGWGMMAQLQKEGKVRWIGVSNFSVSQMQRAQAIAPITSLQPPYSMLVRGIEAEILPFAGANGIGVISYSPMRNGLLSGSMTKERATNFPSDDFRRNLPDYQEPRLSRNLGVAALLREIGARHGRTPGETAIAWVLRRPEVTAAIVGVRGPGQVPGVAGALEFRLSDDEIAEIEAYLTAHPV